MFHWVCQLHSGVSQTPMNNRLFMKKRDCILWMCFVVVVFLSYSFIVLTSVLFNFYILIDVFEKYTDDNVCYYE